MHSLRLKLIFTFLIISVTGTLLTTLIVRSSNERAFDELLREQNHADYVSNMLAYYESNGSWQGVDQVLNSQTSPAMNGQPPAPDQPPPFALANENGRIIIPNRQFAPDSIVPSDALAKGVALELGGTIVGTVLTDDQPPPRDPTEVAFAVQTNRALLLGALGGTAVAIVLAIFMARTLTRPLQELSRASHQMAQGDFQQAVPVRTQDELGDLAIAFNQMSAELDQANQARRQMTADIAHDLRTPLTVLSGYLEAMEDGTLPPTPTRLALMQQEVQTLQQLVADLRTLSLADTGKLILQKEPIALAKLLAQIHDTFSHQAAEQEISLLVEINTVLPTIPLDAARMRQILSNIVSNALRHTPIKGTITLAACLIDDGLQMTVTDTGPGIPSADLPHIFNRFYRGDKARSDDSSGSGLGLAIAQSLVIAHGGTISAHSPIANGQGTCFTITLPEARP